MSTFAFDAYVTTALFDGETAAWALGDGTVRLEDGSAVQAHEGAVLAAALHPKGGVVTGGDDGRLVRSAGGAADTIAELPGRWVEVVRASPASGLIAFSSGRELHVRDGADPKFERVFRHELSVADLAFEPKGRRIAVATYGGAQLWLARIADQRPTTLRYAGSHVAVSFSPDGRFLMSSMQDNQLHGWRLSDGRDMRMGGYPAKVKSMAWLADGMLLATSGASGAVVWPFGGANGPMGKEASEVGVDESSAVTVVAGASKGTLLVAGADDGRIWAADLKSSRREYLKAEKGPPITALALSPKADRVAWGDEEGGAGVAPTPL
jgi:WD40 repeat protein